MVTGVSAGFTRNLAITGVGYRAELRGTQYLLLHLGYSHPILFELPAGVSAVVAAKEGTIALSGADKQVLGATAAEIRALRAPEPYKGKGVRYADETIRRKEGKSGGKGKGKK
jgi:large subunit ribosomal protein L6